MLSSFAKFSYLNERHKLRLMLQITRLYVKLEDGVILFESGCPLIILNGNYREDVNKVFGVNYFDFRGLHFYFLREGRMIAF